MGPCTPSASASANVTISWERTDADAQAFQGWVRSLGVVRDRHGPWGTYLQSVYGPEVAFPYDLQRLHWFWWWAPEAAALTRIEAPVWRRTTPGDVWVPGMRSERHLAAAGFFVHSFPTAMSATGWTMPHASSSTHRPNGGYTSGRLRGSSVGRGERDGDDDIVEVMRVAHATSELNSSSFGIENAAADQTWYWHAPGSGIYLKLGRSLVVQNRTALLGELVGRLSPAPVPAMVCRVHISKERGAKLCEGCYESEELWQDFDVLWPAQHGDEARAHSRCPRGVTRQTSLCELVRNAGFDTVQLTAAFSQRYEIVDCRAYDRTKIALSDMLQPGATAGVANKTKAAAVRACPVSTAHLYARGGQGELVRCQCAAAGRSFLNCGSCALSSVVVRRAQSGQASFLVRPPVAPH